MGKSKPNGGKRWIQELSTKDTVAESEGTFSEDNAAEEIAVELKRKSPTFQAAIGKITLYLNRAGKRLSKSRIKELERVKIILRELYNRKDRQKANKDRPIKIDIKKASSMKVAMQHVEWEDDSGEIHRGDQFRELLVADEEQIKKHYSNLSWENLEKWRDFLINHYFGNKNPNMSQESRNKMLGLIDHKLATDYWMQSRDFPVWDLTDGYDKANFEVITNEQDTKSKKKDDRELVMASKVKSVHRTYDNGETEITFASTKEALRYLADLMEEPIIIKKPTVR